MKCIQCGSEWSVSDKLKSNIIKCPFCNADLKRSEPREIVDVLIEWGNKEGIDFFKNPMKINGLLADMFPDKGRERNALKVALEKGIGTKIVQLHYEDNEGARRTQINQMKQILLEDVWLSEGAADFVMSTLITASDTVGGKIMRASSDIDTLMPCIILFVIDASDSMQGAKISTVNSAIEEIVPELKDISESNKDVALYVGVLKVSNSSCWLPPGLTQAEDFVWHYIHAGGDRNFGAALLELDKRLQYGEFFEDGIYYFKPIIFLLTDGTSSDDYTVGLNLLKENNIFQNAIKVGVAIGDAADRKFLSEFVANEDHVIAVHTPESLKKWIRFEDMQ